MLLTRLGLLEQGFNAHFLHQRPDIRPANFEVHSVELVTQHPGSHKRMFQVKLIYFALSNPALVSAPSKKSF